MYSPSPASGDQPARMWRLRLSALYCVSTKTRRKLELMQFERVMSMMRYSPPKGTAGLARSRVSGHKRSPWPPARRTPMASRISDMDRPPVTVYERVDSNSNGKGARKAAKAGHAPCATSFHAYLLQNNAVTVCY